MFYCIGCSSQPKFKNEIDRFLPEYRDKSLYKQTQIHGKHILKFLKKELEDSNHIIYYMPQNVNVSNTKSIGVVYDVTGNKTYYVSLYRGKLGLLSAIDEETKSNISYVLKHYINRNLTYLSLAGDNCQYELQYSGKQKNIIKAAITEINLHSDNTFFFSFPALVFENGKPLVDAVPLKARL